MAAVKCSHFVNFYQFKALKLVPDTECDIVSV